VHFTDRQWDAWNAVQSHRFVLYGGARGGGKDLSIDTPIPTLTGWKTMNDLEEGDIVFGSDGNPCHVIWASEIQYNKDYELTFSDGSTIICGAGHQWITETKNDRVRTNRRTEEYRKHRRETRPLRGTGKRPDLSLKNSRRIQVYKDTPQPTIKTTQEIVDTIDITNRKEKNHAILTCAPLQLPAQVLPIEPYVLGAWLGDGTSSSGSISGIDDEIFDEISKYGYTITTRRARYQKGILTLSAKLKELGVHKHKHIPQNYLRSSVEQRLALLQGLMDTDGTCDKRGHCQFTNTNKELIDGVHELIVSLGIKTTIHEGRAKLYGKDCGEVYDMNFMTDLPVFRLSRKLARQKTSGFNGVHKRRYIISAKEVPCRPTKCIQVDSSDHTYLAGRNMIPTHNSFFLRWGLLLFLLDLARHGVTGATVGLFCSTYPELRDRQVSKIAGEFPEGLGELRDSQTAGLGYYIRPEYGGGVIALRNLDDPEKYRSAEFAAIGIDELTLTDLETFNYLRGSLRWSGVDRTVFIAGTNPGGKGHGWVKNLWIDRSFPPEMRALSDEFYFVKSLPADNPHLTPQYWEDLNSLPPALSRAWVHGDWDVFEGQALAWVYDRHVVAPGHAIERLPDGWERWAHWRGVDWGFSAPFVCLWLTRDPDCGRVYAYREAYERGLTDRQQARLIMDMTPPDERVTMTYADPSMWASKSSSAIVTSTADEYLAAGVPLTRADNDRLSGKRKIDRLLQNLPDGKPGLVVLPACQNLIRTLPTLAYDRVHTEDIDTSQDDHCYDALRYGLTQAREYTPNKQRPRPPSPFEELIRNGK